MNSALGDATAACFMLAIMLVGFRQFYLHGQAHPGRELTPPIRTLIIVHGVATSGWVLLFLTQTVLIARRQFKTHTAIGRVAAVFAGLILVNDLILSVPLDSLDPHAIASDGEGRGAARPAYFKRMKQVNVARRDQRDERARENLCLVLLSDGPLAGKFYQSIQTSFIPPRGPIST